MTVLSRGAQTNCRLHKRRYPTPAAEGRTMELVHRKCAGLDVHKNVIVACARIVEERGVRRELKRFGTTTAELLALADWMQKLGVTAVLMEATGIYWRPVWNVLEGMF